LKEKRGRGTAHVDPNGNQELIIKGAPTRSRYTGRRVERRGQDSGIDKKQKKEGGQGSKNKNNERE